MVPSLKLALQSNLPPTLLIKSDIGMFRRVVYEYIGDELFVSQMPQTEYTPLDLALLSAYQYYSDSLCQKCGTPAWYGRTEDARVEFDLEHTVCYSCAEIEAEKHSENDPKGRTSYTSVHGTRYADGSEDPVPPPEELITKIK